MQNIATQPRELAKEWRRCIIARMLGKSLLCVVLAIALTAAGIAQKPGPPAPAEKSYYPLAVGNWWLYTVKEPFKKRTSTVKWEVIRKEEEDTFGSRAYQLSSTPAQDDTPLYLAARENGIGYPGTGTD